MEKKKRENRQEKRSGRGRRYGGEKEEEAGRYSISSSSALCPTSTSSPTNSRSSTALSCPSVPPAQRVKKSQSRNDALVGQEAEVVGATAQRLHVGREGEMAGARDGMEGETR